jgi:ATP adenylyltransferase
MESLWAPWRMEYIEAEKKQAGPEKCIFCSLLALADDEDGLVIHRGKKAAVILNRFPYNNGHLMVMPLRHIAKIEELDDEELMELHYLTCKSLKALSAAMEPDGFNLGLNLGKTAGAGVEDHFHLHIVPRWQGDTNFMPVLAETKVMPDHLLNTLRKLKAAFSDAIAQK